jgi:N-acetyl-anhydromuramyl-L-alanine amidase AmpD
MWADFTNLYTAFYNKVDRLLMHNGNYNSNSNINQFSVIIMLTNNWNSTRHKMSEQQYNKLKHKQKC